MNYSALLTNYDAYVDTYRDNSGTLPEMMQLKRVHTARVVRNAGLIADGEGFTADLREAALKTGLLHDTGRYEQLKRYNTFRDADSVDHAVFSHDIVRTLGWLDDDPDREPILAAVLYHNRRDIPDNLDSRTETLSHVVRDADKLDIFTVLETLTAKPNWHEDRRAFWNLDIKAAPNPIVVEAIRNGSSVDYQHIKSLADFVLIQIGWMLSGLHFATTRRLCLERKHLAFRREFLHKLTHDPACGLLCDLAETALAGG